jgi:hypothetical protein
MSNKETADILDEFTYIGNIRNNFNDNDYKRAIDDEITLQCWYHTQGLNANDSNKKFDEKMKELIGFKYNFKKNYEYRTSVWGLTCSENNIQFILMLSERGLMLKVKKDLTNDSYFKIVEEHKRYCY